MLVLSRRCGQKIVMSVGDVEVRFCIAQITGQRVKIAIDAPAQVAIVRAEVRSNVQSLHDVLSGLMDH